MFAAGIAVEMQPNWRPLARVAVLEDTSPQLRIVTLEKVPSDSTDIATQLKESAAAVVSLLRAHSATRVSVRRAERTRRPSNQEGRRVRLLAEGAITSGAKGVVVDTFLANGQDMASWFGTSRELLVAEAAALLSTHGEADRFVEAVAAAIAALRHP